MFKFSKCSFKLNTANKTISGKKKQKLPSQYRQEKNRSDHYQSLSPNLYCLVAFKELYKKCWVSFFFHHHWFSSFLSLPPEDTTVSHPHDRPCLSPSQVGQQFLNQPAAGTARGFATRQRETPYTQNSQATLERIQAACINSAQNRSRTLRFPKLTST